MNAEIPSFLRSVFVGAPVLAEARRCAAECARFIRTNLLFMSPDRPLKTPVVTSPSPQEGKSTTAVTTAISMAQAGSRTLIVDTDMRKAAE